MYPHGNISELPVCVEDVELTLNERETADGFPRCTITVALSGAGHTGRGEDVIYNPALHRRFLSAGTDLALTGEYSFDEFSATLDDLELFPNGTPDRPADRHYRRWAFESAAFDLALKQAGQSLAEAVGRSYEPVSFVVSTRLGDPPTTARLTRLQERNPDLDFKLDPTPDWTPELIDELAGIDDVRVLDFKGLYENVPVAQPPNRNLYERVVEAFPTALFEDPAITQETAPVFEDVKKQVTWDHPITGIDSIKELPYQPRWLNIKPSRFGTVESLLDTIAYCEESGIQMYGGGQYELDVGRQHIHAFASVFHPTAPNDVAPRAYNDPSADEALVGSPLSPPRDAAGLEWQSPATESP